MARSAAASSYPWRPNGRVAAKGGQSEPTLLASVPRHDLIEFPAELPGQAEERDQHHDAQARACGERIRALQLPTITFGSREIAGSSS